MLNILIYKVAYYFGTSLYNWPNQEIYKVVYFPSLGHC